MKIQYKIREYVKFYTGNRQLNCHIEALHATSPRADLYTKDIVEKVMEMADCAGIISTISRTEADLNRKQNEKNKKAMAEYQKTIHEIIQNLGIYDKKYNQLTKPYLHLSIHGMKDLHYGPFGIEIGTLNGKSCSKEIKEWLQKFMEEKSKVIIPNLRIVFDQKFDGDESICYHRLGDGADYLGYGLNYHTFQIEIARTLRKEYQAELAEILSQMIYSFQTLRHRP